MFDLILTLVQAYFGLVLILAAIVLVCGIFFDAEGAERERKRQHDEIDAAMKARLRKHDEEWQRLFGN